VKPLNKLSDCSGAFFDVGATAIHRWGNVRMPCIKTDESIRASRYLCYSLFWALRESQSTTTNNDFTVKTL